MAPRDTGAVAASIAGIVKAVRLAGTARCPRELHTQPIFFTEAMVDLDVPLVAVIGSTGGRDPVVQVIVAGRAHTEIWEGIELHHFERPRVNEVPGSTRKLVGCPIQLGIARALIRRHIVEWNK